ncbi:MAG: TM2 domain-containing protein [Prevotellaceae bacterium]|nr:TM2 domain-containing protein [Prevotellaceae bacterium]
MDQNKVDMFILRKIALFPVHLAPFIRDELSKQDDAKWQSISMLQLKSPMIALLLSLGAGPYGADRFYLGDTALGVCKLVATVVWIITLIIQGLNKTPSNALLLLFLITTSIVILWYFIDIFLVTEKTKKLNYNKLLTSLN